MKVIEADWKTIVTAAETDNDENHTFAGMCGFSMGIMGEEAEGWMQELLHVFPVMVTRISNPASLLEECDLLAISMNNRYKDINFDKFKPVMLAALRSLLPKVWSTTHETAWEWLWNTISRNLVEATIKVKNWKPYNTRLFSILGEEQFEHFRTTIYTDFFSKCATSQEWFKQSQTRLGYIADRVLRSSYDMFQKNKEETLDELSALGLRHVGYGIPIELFAPFTDSCVVVMKRLIESMANAKDHDKDHDKADSEKLDDCPKPKIKAGIAMSEKEEADNMLEGFRWSIGLVARVLMRTITEGSTSVMQSINADDAKLLHKALREAARGERSNLLLQVRVGSQCISPLYWALRSGAHNAAKMMLQDMLTIRADRDRYYYGVNDIFRLQPDVAEHILLEAPLLAVTLLDGLIWRSHKTKDGLRPVIYYCQHLMQDMDEEKTFSRALISFVKYDNPKTIMHPMLIFVLDILWDQLARRTFFLDRVLTVVSFVIFFLATCFLTQPGVLQDPTNQILLATARTLIYTMGFLRLLSWHTYKMYKSCSIKDFEPVFLSLSLPRYLLRGPEIFSFVLMINFVVMMSVEPMFHCLGQSEDTVTFECDAFSDAKSLVYEICGVLGIFLYAIIVLDMANISITLCEYKVLCSHALKQVVLCILVVAVMVVTFSFAIASMTREAANLTSRDWTDMGSTMTSLVQLAGGVMDTAEMRAIANESPLLFMVIVVFMLIVYSFFWNLLVSLARGEVILHTLEAIKMKRWNAFMASLAFDKRVDFEEGDIGLAGGIKAFEPTLAHPVTQDQIIRFGGDTDQSLPWPEKYTKEDENTMERIVQKQIQHSLKKYLGGGRRGDGSTTEGSRTGTSHSSSSHSDSL